LTRPPAPPPGSSLQSGTLPHLGTRWWTPLAFVILSLVLLLVTPLLVERRVAALRADMTEGSEAARIALNDLEAAFASQLLVDSAEQIADTSAVATPAHINLDEVDLLTAARQMDSAAMSRAERLSEQVRVWSRTTTAPRSPSGLAQARAFFATAEEFDRYLEAESTQQRAHVRTLERFALLTSVVLALIALIAAVVVVFFAVRLFRFAEAAEGERAEVVRAADTRAALLRGVTHDVKNPLGAAAGYAQLLNEGVAGALTAPQTEMVRRIERLVQTAVRTVTDLLELARADGAGLQLEYAEIDLSALAAECVEDHMGQARERGQRVQVSGAATHVVTDPVRVQQVLANLLTNAVKYTPDGGEIIVATVHGPDEGGRRRVGIEVRDTGPGIPPELRAHVFEEFFRVRREGGAPGNGLGLAISRRLARLLGGEVTFEDNTPRGAVFTLWLDASGGASYIP
jgi:signal transduction histidine kinase